MSRAFLVYVIKAVSSYISIRQGSRYDDHKMDTYTYFSEDPHQYLCNRKTVCPTTHLIMCPPGHYMKQEEGAPMYEGIGFENDYLSSPIISSGDFGL